MNLISNIDSRLDIEDMSPRNIAKMYCFHIRFFGPNSCLIVDEDVEIDPVDDLGITEENIKSCEEKFKNEQERKQMWEEYKRQGSSDSFYTWRAAYLKDRR